jgi:hypothetical protein
MKTQRVVLMAAVAVPLLFAGLAQAQPYGGPPQGYGPPPSDDYGPPQPQSPDQTAAMLRRRLRLRPDQDVALNSFVRSIAPPPGMEARMRREESAARTMTTPQRLDAMMENMNEMRQVMIARVEATKAFYAQLTPEQQHAFDAMGAAGEEGGGMGPGPGAYQDRQEPYGGPNAPAASGGFAQQ